MFKDSLNTTIKIPVFALLFMTIGVFSCGFGIYLSNQLMKIDHTNAQHDFLHLANAIHPSLAIGFGPIITKGGTIPRISEVRTTRDHSKICLQKNHEEGRYLCFSASNPIEVYDITTQQENTP